MQTVLCINLAININTKMTAAFFPKIFILKCVCINLGIFVVQVSGPWSASMTVSAVKFVCANTNLLTYLAYYTKSFVSDAV